jgi:hypothetical protein
VIAGEVPPRDEKVWAALINAAWRKSIEGIIETGRLLIEAKARLKHGQWLPMLNRLHFDVRTAQKLMEVARHPVLSNTSSIPHLPPSWSTLHVLAKLPAEKLERHIEDGTVRPDMEQRDAEAIAWRDKLDRSAAANASMHVEDVPDRREPAPIKTWPVTELRRTTLPPRPAETEDVPPAKPVVVQFKRDDSTTLEKFIRTFVRTIDEEIMVRARAGEFDTDELRKLSDNLIDRGSELLEIVNKREGEAND